MASAKKEETDIFDLLKDLAKNWHIMLPCIILAGAVGSSAPQIDIHPDVQEVDNDGLLGI